jgi:ABC-2 type transport system permease protein/lipopolysaccharide transport system permease protein
MSFQENTVTDAAESLSRPPLTLRVYDVSEVPAEPDPSTMHRHRWRPLPALRNLWARREIVFTLAERDIRASYKETALGVAWAVLTPLATLIVMVLVFKRVKAFNDGGVPYALFAYLGLLPWQYFSSSLSSGANSLLSNKALLSKVHFPRECFPLAQLLEAALNTLLATSVLVVLFLINHFTPHIESLWVPLFLVIELLFCAGVVLAASALLVHVRDLVQLLPVIVSLGLFATPVIWPFDKISPGFQALYSVFNPLGPVIDNIRRTVLHGQAPTWGLLGIATASALAYLVGGYAIFKRLEAELADIA